MKPPIIIIREELDSLKNSGFVDQLIRNSVMIVASLLAFGVFLVVMFLLTNLLQSFIGGWGIAIGGIITLGVALGALVTAMEHS